MATPVYFYTMNGQMKTLIDRTYARYTEIRDKEMAFIMTAAVGRKSLLERTLEGFRGIHVLSEQRPGKGGLLRHRRMAGRRHRRQPGDDRGVRVGENDIDFFMTSDAPQIRAAGSGH